MAIGALLMGAFSAVKGIATKIVPKIKSAGGIKSFIKGKVKPDGFLSKIAPNIVGRFTNGQQVQPQTKGFKNGDLVNPEAEAEAKKKRNMFIGIGAGVLALVGGIIAIVRGRRPKGNNRNRRR